VQPQSIAHARKISHVIPSRAAESPARRPGGSVPEVPATAQPDARGPRNT
jgi:hypothetical protein